MLKTRLGFAILVSGILSCAFAAPLKEVRVADPAQLLPADGAAVNTLTAHLVALEKATDLRVLIEFHPASPSKEEDKEPGQYMRALATKLGTIRAGVLMVYFADEDDWRVWIGDELTPRFVGRPGTAAEFTENGAMHDAKEAWLTTTMAAADAAFQAQLKPGPLDGDKAKSVRRLLQAEALIEGLRTKFSR